MPASHLIFGPRLSEPARFPRWQQSLALFGALVLLQMPLWINPGYFSHDELQWGARAATASVGALPWLSFSAWDVFQFRPLTFNLWLLLSHVLFDSPRLFHAVFVLLGSFNAVVLAGILRRAGCGATVADGAALVFGLSPFSVWVHGWVGCLGDLLWVGFALALVAVLQRLTGSGDPACDALPPRDRNGRLAAIVAASAAALATALALLSKEAALSMPALLALGTLLLRMPRHWLAATLASSLIALVYLALRLDVLTTPGDVANYTLHATALPVRWLEYMSYPWALDVREVHVLQRADAAKWLLWAIAPLLLAVCLWRASPRLWLAWLLGGVLALGPVLALPVSANQYGYGFSALCCGIVALAWQRWRYERGVVLLLALVAVAHGFQIQRHMLEIGRLQATFSPSLAEQARRQPRGPILLWPEHASHLSLYGRLTHEVATWHGVRLGTRVAMAETPAQATHMIAPDGQVQARKEAP